jgi:hypothetical protein
MEMLLVRIIFQSLMHLSILLSIGNGQKIFWDTTSRSSRGRIFKTSFVHPFLHMTGRWMLSFLFTTIEIPLLTCYLLRMVRGLYHFRNWNHVAFLFSTLFMMKPSLLLMNLMKLVKKDICFPKSCKYLFISFYKKCETVDGDYVMTLQGWVIFYSEMT